MIPNWSWNWESWQNSGLSEIWYNGRSAGKRRTVRSSWDLFTRGSAEKFSTAKLHCGRFAKGPWTVRLSSVHPASFGYTDGLLLSKARTVLRRSADSPPVLGRIYQRQFQSAVRSIFSEADGPLQGSRTIRACAEQWGQPELTYIEVSLSFSPTNPHQTSKSSLPFSLKHVGEMTRSRLFGMVPGRSEHIPGLFSR